MFPQEVISDVILLFLQSRELSKMRAVSPACKDTVDEMQRYRVVRDLVTTWRKAPVVNRLSPEEFVKIPDNFKSSVEYKWYASHCRFITVMSKHGEAELCSQHACEGFNIVPILAHHGHKFRWGEPMSAQCEKEVKIARGNFGDLEMDVQRLIYSLIASMMNGFTPPNNVVDKISTWGSLEILFIFTNLYNKRDLIGAIMRRSNSLGWGIHILVGAVKHKWENMPVLSKAALIRTIYGALSNGNIPFLREAVKHYRDTYGDSFENTDIKFTERHFAILKLI